MANIPVVDLREWNAGGAARERFVRAVGESLADKHAKDSPSPDLKEFWQIGRPDFVHPKYGENSWPSEVSEFGPTLVELYRRLDELGGVLLEASALYLGEPANCFRDNYLMMRLREIGLA